MPNPGGTTPTARRCAVLPGNFDGVHLGHRALVARTVEVANALGVEPVALTFDPHPLRVVAPERAPALLTTLEHRIDILKALGLSRVVVRRFDTAFAQQSADSFVHDVLMRELTAAAVVVGPDFRFGANRAGDLVRLQTLGQAHALRIDVVPPVVVGGQVVSSSRIRALIREGAVHEARALLARPHEVRGRVVHGDGRGRAIGVPTANLAGCDVLLPGDGVYAVRVHFDDAGQRSAGGMAHLGVRPTFDAGATFEVHIFDTNESLYDRTLRVQFLERLRPAQTFSGVDALKAQLRLDETQAREVLARERA